MELEHETFRNAKVANLYKASVLKKVGTGRGGWGVLRALGGRGSPPHRAHLFPGEPDFPPFPAGSISSQPRVD